VGQELNTTCNYWNTVLHLRLSGAHAFLLSVFDFDLWYSLGRGPMICFRSVSPYSLRLHHLEGVGKHQSDNRSIHITQSNGLTASIWWSTLKLLPNTKHDRKSEIMRLCRAFYEYNNDDYKVL